MSFGFSPVLIAEMSRFSLDNNNFPYDNNVLVLDMVLGSLWGISQPINWDNVAKLVPGFTPNEVTTPTLHPSSSVRTSAWFCDSRSVMTRCC